MKKTCTVWKAIRRILPALHDNWACSRTVLSEGGDANVEPMEGRCRVRERRPPCCLPKRTTAATAANSPGGGRRPATIYASRPRLVVRTALPRQPNRGRRALRHERAD